MAEPNLDLDQTMQRIREELETSSPTPLLAETADQPAAPAVRTRSPRGPLFSELTLQDGPPFSKPKLTLAQRLDIRRIFHRMLGLREVGRLEPVFKSLRRAPIPLSALPTTVNVLKSSIVDLRAAILRVSENSVDVEQFDELRREFAEFLQMRAEDLEARLTSTRDEVASAKTIATETARKMAALHRDIIDHVDDRTAHFTTKIGSLETGLADSASVLQIASAVAGKCEAIVDDHERRLWETKAALDKVERKILDHWRHIADQNRRLSLLLTEIRRKAQDGLQTSDIASIEKVVDHQLSALYVSFEDVYRGTRADIMERQKVYLPPMRQAVAASNARPVVDLGCGRGEFLELLRVDGIRALGVDQNSVMVSECLTMALEAVESDIIAYLKEQSSASLSGLTSFHVVEHLPYRTLIEFLDDAFRVLAPGGVLMLETPNPANLIVAAERFHMDPTHVKPLPSDLLSFLAEARGFVNVEVMPLHPVRAPRQHYDDEFLRLLQDKIYGPQDYGLIAWKAQ
jgi:SAM-dependent methyltransferase